MPGIQKNFISQVAGHLTTLSEAVAMAGNAVDSAGEKDFKKRKSGYKALNFVIIALIVHLQNKEFCLWREFHFQSYQLTTALV